MESNNTPYSQGGSKKLLTNNVFQALQIEGNVSGRKPLFLGCEGHDSYLQMI